MKQIYRWLAVVCLLIPLAIPAISAEEFRGMYVDAFHPGFKTHEETTKMVAAAKAAHFNALIVQVRKRGDAYYSSSIEPKASDISPDYDPLADIIKQAHAVGLEVHAWIAVYEVSNEAYTLPGNHVCLKHPEWIMKADDGKSSFYNGRVYLDPGIPAVTEYTVSVIRDILARYDVDGINLDNVRYPGTEGGYNATAVALFNEQTGSAGTPAVNTKGWRQWRCEQVTALVSAARTVVRTTNSAAKLSASVMFSDPEHATAIVCQQWDAWLKNGLVDFVIPMAYAKADTISSHAERALKSTCGRHIYMGIGAYQLSQTQAEKQIADCRSQGTKGVVLYSYHYLCTAESPDRAKCSALGASVFEENSELPLMPWR